MIRITKSSARVLHGHARKKGSKRDKPKGALIKAYSFKKYGKKGAVKRARAMHYAIIMSQKRRRR